MFQETQSEKYTKHDYESKNEQGYSFKNTINNSSSEKLYINQLKVYYSYPHNLRDKIISLNLFENPTRNEQNNINKI